MLNRWSKTFIISLLVCSSFVLKAQYGSFGLTDARQLGLGNTYASNSRELYAAGKNPSLLAWSSSERQVSILFPNLSARAYNVNTVSNFFNDFFSQKPIDIITGISGNVIKRALDNGGSLYLGLQIGFLGAGYYPNEKIGAFSFAMKDYLNGLLRLPQSIVDYNNGVRNIKGYYLNDFNFQCSWLRAYEISWGRKFNIDPSTGIGAIYAGIGVKYYNGYIYNKVSFSGGAAYEDSSKTLIGSYQAQRVAAYSDDISVDSIFTGGTVIQHVPFMKPTGRGVGFDFGLTLMLIPGAKVAISVTDAGFINWQGKTKKTYVDGIIKIDSTLSIDNIDSLSKFIIIKKVEENHFRTNPPTALHIGVCFMVQKFVRNFPGEMNVALEIHQGLDNLVDNPVQPRVALGMDWKPGKWWPVFLTGLTTNQNSDFSWSLGLGYDLKWMEIYFSSPDVLAKLKGSDVQNLSLSICWHFIRMNRPERSPHR